MDWDGAEYELGRAVGLFADVAFPQAKHVFWSNNELGSALWEMLHCLVRAGVLEHRDDDMHDHQFRWSPTAPVDGTSGTGRSRSSSPGRSR